MVNNPSSPRSTDTAPVVPVSPAVAAATGTPGLSLLYRIELLVLALATASLPVLTDLAILTPKLSADIGSGLLAVAIGLHLPGAALTVAGVRRTRGGG